MADFTEPNETPQDRQLSVRQLNAVELLIRGKNDRQVAEAVGVTRETVNTWRNHDPLFKAALQEARGKLWANEQEALKERVQKVLATPLLSLAGIKARLELKDHLILQDILDYNEKRARLIQRLETDIEQARFYLDSINKDDAVAQQVALETTDYKQTLLRVLLETLDALVTPQLRDAVLDEVGKKMPS